MANDDTEISTLDDLVTRSPVEISDACVDTRVNPTQLYVDGTSFQMGLLSSKQQLARGLTRYTFHTGPYRIQLTRNDQKRGDARYRIVAKQTTSD